MFPRSPLLDVPQVSDAPANSQACVDIWWWPYDADVDWHRICDGLTLEEKSRAATFHYEKDAISFIAGRHLQRAIVSKYTSIPVQDLHIAAGPHGKPCLTNSVIAFNLTNAEGLAALAISRDCSAVGIDAEPMARVIETEASSLFCSSAELDILSTLPPGEARSLRLSYWVLKESLVKATGTGFVTAPNQLTIRLDRPTNAIRFDNPIANGNTSWHHHLLQGPGHLIAISAQTDRAQLILRQREFSSLPGDYQ